MQEHVLTQPLELVYDAVSKTKLPVELKTKVRRAMRQQQDTSTVAIGALACPAGGELGRVMAA